MKSRFLAIISATAILMTGTLGLAKKRAPTAAELDSMLKKAAIAGKISPDDLFDLRAKLNDLRMLEAEAAKDSKIKPAAERQAVRLKREIQRAIKNGSLKSFKFKTPHGILKEKVRAKKKEIISYRKKALADGKLSPEEKAHLMELQLQLQEMLR